ncbi:SAM-dependent methyltransferase [Sphingomonas panacisoli]|uniref:SAM-dependent methyltransferase n=1 Tax=Sphingomonas panacisoli TaxID=1813879 RepID=UPI001F000FB7|nr:SAM-dependent methyltransferase [Sphingomonas panacisoli]
MISLAKLPVGTFDVYRHVPVVRAASTRADALPSAETLVQVQPNVAKNGGKRGQRKSKTDYRPSDVRLDQYYTRPGVAKHFYRIFKQHFDPARYLMIEPSAGMGSFYKLLPPGSLAYDVEPKYPGIIKADFLTVHVKSSRQRAIIGNPPFGKNASTAVKFFNHAARQADVIALIVPRSFRKASIENRLNRFFHLVREELVPDNAFHFRGKPYNVPALFQIWERRTEPRQLRPVETRHPDFEFTTPALADFAIQRVGARAGRVHRDFTRSPNSHYFIKAIAPGVEAIMRKLNFASVVGNVAGNPSLSRSEIVALYHQQIPRSSSPPDTLANDAAGIRVDVGRLRAQSLGFFDEFDRRPNRQAVKTANIGTLPTTSKPARTSMMSSSERIIADVVRRAPNWMRRDLLSDDRVVKAAAEEALSAMIANALVEKPS